MIRLPILMYHSVSSPTGRFAPWCVSPEMLRSQLKEIVAAGYTVCGLTEALGNNSGGPVVALTFDDGYADFAESALPLLTEIGARATLYVVAGEVGGSAAWLPWEEERHRPLMEWGQIRQLPAEGVEVGSHGHHHVELDAVPLTVAEGDVRDSKRLVEEHLGEVLSFCYPFGYHNRQVRDLVASCGFSNACEIGHAIATRSANPFRLSRLMVHDGMDGPSLMGLINGPERTFRSVAREALRPVWREVRRHSPHGSGGRGV
jgi:peptidoglycan/xylan/chitin deacetylase (PgdA/CDA1 family)